MVVGFTHTFAIYLASGHEWKTVIVSQLVIGFLLLVWVDRCGCGLFIFL